MYHGHHNSKEASREASTLSLSSFDTDPSPGTAPQQPPRATTHEKPETAPPSAIRILPLDPPGSSTPGPHGIFAGLRIVVLEAGRGMGRRRAQVMRDLIHRHGGVVYPSIQRDATHVVTGQDRWCWGPSAKCPFSVPVVRPAWVSDSMIGGRVRDPGPYLVDLDPAPVSNAPMLQASSSPSTIQTAITEAQHPIGSETYPVKYAPPLKREPPASPPQWSATVPLQTAAGGINQEPASSQSSRSVPTAQAVAAAIPFACQRGAKRPLDPEEAAGDPDTTINIHVIEELQKLQGVYGDTGDNWRKYAYGKAIGVIRKLDHPISVDEARHLKGIGPKIAAKIEEILATGTSRRLHALESNDTITAMREFGKIWGVGPATSRQLYAQGFRSISDLRLRPEVLTAPQRVGLRHFDAFQQRIPRAEVAVIEAIVRTQFLNLRAKAHVVTCGSYRRGLATSGDVDILICDLTGKVHCGLLPLLVGALTISGFLTDNLAISTRSVALEDPESYMGVCKVPPCADPSSCPCSHVPSADSGSDSSHLHRRIDIKVYPQEMFPFAILYFTGSDYFNRSMRLFCHQKGFSLSDKGLVSVVRIAKGVVHEGPRISCGSEKDIFAAIGLEYKEPHERSV